jgi:hypothetical protein
MEEKCIPYIKVYDEKGQLINPIDGVGYRHPTRENFGRLEPVIRGQKLKRIMQKMTGTYSWAEEMKIKLHFRWLERHNPAIFS